MATDGGHISITHKSVEKSNDLLLPGECVGGGWVMSGWLVVMRGWWVGDEWAFGG